MSTIFKKWKVQITINLLLKGFSSFLNLSMHLVLASFFFLKCYFKANSDLLVFYKGFTVYIETFLIHFPKPQKKVIIDLKKGNYTVSGHPTLVVISALGDRSGVHYSLYVDLNNLMNRHVDVICM